MASINKVTIIGHLGRDPELRYLPSGEAVCNVSVATSEKWKDKGSGEPREHTEWHRISAFSKTAEIIGQYGRKGSLVYVEGSLRTREYTDTKTSAQMKATEIKVDRFLILSGGRDNQAHGTTAAPAPAPPRPATSDQSFDSTLDDDIPF